MSVQSKQKDKEMAAHMKAKGIKRVIARCPICHHEVSLKKIYAHIISCR